MKNAFKLVLIFSIFISTSAIAQKYDVEESDKTIKEFKKTDPEIEKFFNNAYGYAVLYSVGKGAVGVGGAGGKGTVYEKPSIYFEPVFIIYRGQKHRFDVKSPSINNQAAVIGWDRDIVSNREIMAGEIIRDSIKDLTKV